MSTEIEVKIDEKIKQVIKEPENYKVIFLNDNVTPMEFVIDILIKIFKHTAETARDLTLKIHKEGSIIVGLYTYEIAEQKGMEATNESRSLGYPLQVKIEKE
jgi:ATP-dependent Clp protease adaptor protein ClpS|tara:strand:- start:41283 stop:41588 length:306 start_codon:yes stop_codon:yes gene_type:complete